MQRSQHFRISLFVALLALQGCLSGTLSHLPILSPDEEGFKIEPLYAIEDDQFLRTVGHLLGPPIVTGNKIETLVNGDQIFPAMLSAIREAKDTITLETYIYWDGKIGKEFADALSERAQAGVKVHVIVDWFGLDGIHTGMIDQMTKAGAQIKIFNELEWYNPVRWTGVTEADHRTHRKILVVDGKVGFIGGVGIADEWSGDARSPKEWRDNHYRVEGPVVAQLQSAFIDNWLELGGSLLHGKDYFPELKPAGDLPAQSFKSSPHEVTASVELMYRVAFAAAKRDIKIESAYFVPDPGMIKDLSDAAKRGVNVEVIVPGTHIDEIVVRAASRGIWGPLLESGVHIYEFQPTMFHCKSIIIDGYFSSIGSANFDSRSFHLNDEANINVFNRSFAAEQEKIFDADKKRSKEITFAAWRKRPLWERFGNYFFRMFRDEL